MLCLTRLNGSQVFVNPVHIVTIESTPDTLIQLFSGDRMLVRESPDVIADLMLRFIRTGTQQGPVGGELAAVVRLVPQPKPKKVDGEE